LTYFLDFGDRLEITLSFASPLSDAGGRVLLLLDGFSGELDDEGCEGLCPHPIHDFSPAIFGTIAAIPEPSALAYIALGVGALILWRKQLSRRCRRSFVT